MISLTISDLNQLTAQDATALRAIADTYHPFMPRERVVIADLKAALAREVHETGPGAAHEILLELNRAATGVSTERQFNLAEKEPTPLIDPTTPPPLGQQFVESLKKTAERMGAKVRVGAAERKVIDPDDNPATGAPDQHALADKVFGGGAVLTNEQQPDPAQVFSGGASGHGYAALDQDAAKLEALAGEGAAGITLADIDPAQVFSGGASNLAEAIAQGPGADVAAQVFGGGADLPNVQSAQSAQSSPIQAHTTPPLPGATPQTTPQPSAGATSASPPPPPAPAPAPASVSDAAPSTNDAPISAPPGVVVDKAGLPWDARIHASTKTMTAKGIWTRRRGIEDSLVTEVEAQLRTAMAIPAAPAATTPPPPATTGAWPFPTDSSSVTGNPPPPADAPPTFPTLMTFITERVGDKRLTPPQVTAAVQAVGLESINLAMSRPDLIPAIMAELQKVAP